MLASGVHAMFLRKKEQNARINGVTLKNFKWATG